MNRIHLLLFLCCMSSTWGFAQSATDSLRFFNELAQALVRTNPDSSRAFASRAIALAKRQARQPQLAVAYKNHGFADYAQGKLEEAQLYLDSARVIYEALRDTVGMCEYFIGMGNTFYVAGSPKEAEIYYSKGLKICLLQGAQYDYYRVSFQNNLGVIANQEREFKKARSYFIPVMKYHEAKDNRQRTSLLYANIGMTYLAEDSLARGLGYLLKALQIRREIGDRAGLGVSYGKVAYVYMLKQQNQEAENYFKLALEIWHNMGNMYQVAYCDGFLGKVYSDTRRFAQADSILRASYEVAKAQGYLITQHSTERFIGESFVAQKRYSEAIPYLAAGLAYFEEVQNIDNQRQILENLVLACKKDKQRKQSRLYKQKLEALGWPIAEK